MKTQQIDGQDYRLPSSLNAFQQDMYVHLINWKRQHVTREPGIGPRGLHYDAILPDSYADQYPFVYPDVVDSLKQHRLSYPFRTHLYFNHMASSQAANINLFLPLLQHANVNAILGRLKPDFARLATEKLDRGYQLEFWGDKPNGGHLNDKKKVSGTDADIAIAYYNHEGELCLWLIEHKLTEDEFTDCGGYKSNQKHKNPRRDCRKSFAELVADKHWCYYHDKCHFAYWDITADNQAFFANGAGFTGCPFRGGLNQLWRNQLLGLSIEQDTSQGYKHVTFSVVKHKGNISLDKSLDRYRELIAHNPKFSVFTSTDVIEAAGMCRDAELDKWIAWYRDLYSV